ncbi:MAG TPA: hypothetical protein VG407_18830 [Caulobacteraceae bacterium]|jgi:hypothetical protein|nr:hypothetical protein [Caulobacteraceae bacterium]
MRSKSLLFASIAIAGSGLLFASAAAAQTTGTITVTGTVGASCTVTGTSGATTFADTISLGELDSVTPTTGPVGTLSTTLSNSTQGSPFTAASKSYQVTCNSGNPTLDVKATRLSLPGATLEAGYSGNIDYSTDVIAAKAGGGTTTATYTTAATLPSDTIKVVGDRLANAPGNLVVHLYGFAAENGASSLLDSGSTWASTITIKISPTS